jgi:HK97 family phage major capsid protein
MRTVEVIMTELQTIVDGAEERSLNDEEATQYENLEKELATVRKDNEIRSRQEAYKTPIRTDLGVHTGTAKKDDTLERAFDHYLRTGRENQDLMELRAQAVGTDTAGGFLVPPGFRDKLTERMKEFGGVANAVEVITTADGRPLEWPFIDDTANEGEIAAEGAAGASGDDLVFSSLTLGAFKYVAPGASNLPLRVSVELLQDSAFDIQSLVARKLGERIARKQSKDWVTGNGTTEPFGLDTNAEGESTFTAAGITYAELVAALHNVDPSYRANGVWAFNDATLEKIRLLVDGNDRPLLSDSTVGINAGWPTTLLGHPVVIDQAFADYTDATTNNWGVFGDLREGYVIRRVKDLQVIVDPYTRMNEGQVQYSVWARADGNVQNKFAYSVLINAT